jgi:hypothetical protein
MKCVLCTTVAALAVVYCGLCAAADTPPQAAVDPAILANLDRIRQTAIKSDWAWELLEDLVDHIGPRLSGSPQNAAAIGREPNLRISSSLSRAIWIPGIWVPGQRTTALALPPLRA